jgi:hypothetical protein
MRGVRRVIAAERVLLGIVPIEAVASVIPA